MKDLPSISIIIPTHNSARYIKACLESIFRQEYPSSLLKVLIVDYLGSTDDTLEIASDYDVEILCDKTIDGYTAKMLGFRKTDTDLFIYLDADIELACDGWFEKMVFPFLDDPSITASFTRFLPKKSDPPLNRYLAYHDLMLDPVLRFFCPSVQSTVVENKRGYRVCIFEPRKIPPAGVQLYRMDVLRQVLNENDVKWLDVEVPLRLVKHGYRKFAYVEDAGIYHLTVKKFRDLVWKKRWMVTKSFLPNLQSREYRYLDFGNKRIILKLFGWVFYANLFLPAFVKGATQSIWNRDLACMYHPVVTMFLTDFYIYHFLKSKEGRGLLKSLFHPELLEKQAGHPKI